MAPTLLFGYRVHNKACHKAAVAISGASEKLCVLQSAPFVTTLAVFNHFHSLRSVFAGQSTAGHR